MDSNRQSTLRRNLSYPLVSLGHSQGWKRARSSSFAAGFCHYFERSRLVTNSDPRSELFTDIRTRSAPAHGVTYFKYASILLQEMTIEVDEDFLFAFLDFAKFSGASGTDVPKCAIPLQLTTLSFHYWLLCDSVAFSPKIQREFLNQQQRRKEVIFTLKSFICSRCSSTFRSCEQIGSMLIRSESIGFRSEGVSELIRLFHSTGSTPETLSSSSSTFSPWRSETSTMLLFASTLSSSRTLASLYPFFNLVWQNTTVLLSPVNFTVSSEVPMLSGKTFHTWWLANRAKQRCPLVVTLSVSSRTFRAESPISSFNLTTVSCSTETRESELESQEELVVSQRRQYSVWVIRSQRFLEVSERVSFLFFLLHYNSAWLTHSLPLSRSIRCYSWSTISESTSNASIP